MDNTHIGGKFSARLSDTEVFLCKSEYKIAKHPVEESFPVEHSSEFGTV